MGGAGGGARRICRRACEFRGGSSDKSAPVKGIMDSRQFRRHSSTYQINAIFRNGISAMITSHELLPVNS